MPIPKRMEPMFIEPMQCKPVTSLSAGEKWTFEIKFDGYRCIALRARCVVSSAPAIAQDLRAFRVFYAALTIPITSLRLVTAAEVCRQLSRHQSNQRADVPCLKSDLKMTDAFLRGLLPRCSRLDPARHSAILLGRKYSRWLANRCWRFLLQRRSTYRANPG